MGYTNSTPHYNLPQYIASDKPSWLGDFNAAMLKIDTEISGAAANAGAAVSQSEAAVQQVSAMTTRVNELDAAVEAAVEAATTATGTATAAIERATTAEDTANVAKARADEAYEKASEGGSPDFVILSPRNNNVSAGTSTFALFGTYYIFNASILTKSNPTERIEVGENFYFYPLLRAHKNVFSLEAITPSAIGDFKTVAGNITRYDTYLIGSGENVGVMNPNFDEAIVAYYSDDGYTYFGSIQRKTNVNLSGKVFNVSGTYAV